MRIPFLKCKACTSLFLQPKYVCSSCLSNELEPIDIEGTGTIYSFTTIHSAPAGKKVPYHVILVELENGQKVTGNLVDQNPSTEPYIGQKVTFLKQENDGSFCFE